MSLTLTKRIPNGSPLTATQNDANMTAIEGAVNTNTTAVGLAALASTFEAVVTGKTQIDYANVINIPSNNPFRGVSSTDQNVNSNTSAHIAVNTVTFDPSGGFSTSGGTFISPTHGYYQVNFSAAVAIISGSPTDISMLMQLRKNSVGFCAATQDTAGDTGTRIYGGSDVVELNVGDVVDLYITIVDSGGAVWKVQSGATFSGFMVAKLP